MKTGGEARSRFESGQREVTVTKTHQPASRLRTDLVPWLPFAKARASSVGWTWHRSMDLRKPLYGGCNLFDKFLCP